MTEQNLPTTLRDVAAQIEKHVLLQAAQGAVVDRKACEFLAAEFGFSTARERYDMRESVLMRTRAGKPLQEADKTVMADSGLEPEDRKTTWRRLGFNLLANKRKLTALFKAEEAQFTREKKLELGRAL